MTRACGECNLCCKLVPVKTLEKKAGERCKHQRATGCRIYSTRPAECRAWNCIWLVNDINGEPVDLRRPDRSHYVIDMIPDFVVAVDHDNGDEQYKIPVLQIWVDPDYPDAHRDPQLRAFLERRGREGIASLIRYGSHGPGLVLIPPAMTDGGQFREMSSANSQAQHTRDEINEVLKVTYES